MLRPFHIFAEFWKKNNDDRVTVVVQVIFSEQRIEAGHGGSNLRQYLQRPRLHRITNKH